MTALPLPQESIFRLSEIERQRRAVSGVLETGSREPVSRPVSLRLSHYKGLVPGRQLSNSEGLRRLRSPTCRRIWPGAASNLRTGR